MAAEQEPLRPPAPGPGRSRREEEVEDYAHRLYRRIRGENAPLPDYFVDAQGLTPEDHLVMQAGAYQHGTFVVGVAKGGDEEGVPAIAGSAIIAPSGEIVAQAATLGDELIVARCDLDLTKSYKETVFNFARHRQPQAYGLITERTQFFIAHHMDALALKQKQLPPERRRELEASPDFEDLLLLRDLDQQGRVPGIQVGSVDEALDYLRELERTNNG